MKFYLALISLHLFIFSGCGVGGGEYPVNEDYYISVANSHQVTINNSNKSPSIVVGPHVVGLNSNSELIIGEVHQPREALDLGASPGYFIIDLSSNTILTGLSLYDFQEVLRKHSINEFDLKQPSSLYKGDL